MSNASLKKLHGTLEGFIINEIFKKSAQALSRAFSI